MELAVTVDGGVVVGPLGGRDGEQGEQGYSSSSSLGRHLYASGTEQCGDRPGLPRSNVASVLLR